MLVKLPRNKPELIDYRETAPAAARKDMFINDLEKSRVVSCQNCNYTV